jgi:hypothetical protein
LFNWGYGLIPRIIITLTILASCQSIAKDIQDRPKISIWAYNAFEQSITRRKLSKYFIDLGDSINHEISLEISNNIKYLLNNCHSGTPSIVLAGKPVTEQLINECKYNKFVITLQQISLLTLKDKKINRPEDVRRVGLIRSIEASSLGRQELSSINSDYISIEYPTIFDLIKNHEIDNINSIVIAPSVLKTAPHFSEKWRNIHNFKKKGELAVVASPLIDDDLLKIIKEHFLTNNNQSIEIWQKGVGLGKFIEPIKHK